jgi:hypothetical protein
MAPRSRSESVTSKILTSAPTSASPLTHTEIE